MVAPRIDIPHERLAAFARKWKIKSIALFGSVLRDDFRPDSDVDFLVEFDSDAGWSLWDKFDMKAELEALVGRDVDLIDREAIATSRNWVRRRAILDSARSIYGS